MSGIGTHSGVGLRWWYGVVVLCALAACNLSDPLSEGEGSQNGGATPEDSGSDTITDTVVREPVDGGVSEDSEGRAGDSALDAGGDSAGSGADGDTEVVAGDTPDGLDSDVANDGVDGLDTSGDGDACADQEQCNDVDDDCDGTVDEGCPCTYDPTEEDQIDTDGSHGSGVCTGQERKASGDCGQPSGFQSTESSCSDGSDNDCDGDIDFDDLDCKKSAGSSCSSSTECLGQCKPFSGAAGRVCAHRIFVTSQQWTGDLGGLSGGDQKCNQAAAAQNLGGNWQAILSGPNVDAKKRITISGRLLNLSGVRVAKDKSDLWDDTIDAPVERDETNSVRDVLVWTGTVETGHWDGDDGEPEPDDCGGAWVSSTSDDQGEVGDSTETDGNWLVNARGNEQYPCDKTASLYCVDGQ